VWLRGGGKGGKGEREKEGGGEEGGGGRVGREGSERQFFTAMKLPYRKIRCLTLYGYKMCTMCTNMCLQSIYVVVTLAMYLHYIFWSAETKVHSIDGESNGRKTVYFTAFKYVLGRRRRRRKGGRGRGE